MGEPAEAARTAARRAGVNVRSLRTAVEMAQATELVNRVWHSADTSPLEAPLLRALAHTGNYVAGAFERAGGGSGDVGDPAEGGAMVGLSVGFLTFDPERGLHSHITCTTSERRDAGLGAALKLHQRAWAYAAGLTSITWTFDPLVRRNAYFNLAKLGARAVAYLPEFYGPMDDGVNAGDESDRLLLRWDVPAKEQDAGPAGQPDSAWNDVAENCSLRVGPDDGEPCRCTVTGDVVACQIPADIVALRERDPDQALRWRHALRDALTGALDDGYHVQGFTRSGCYVLTRRTAVP